MANFRLDQTVKVAIEKFQQKMPDIMATLSGAQYIPDENLLVVNFLGVNYTVSYPEGDVTSSEKSEISLTEKILILHYLYYAQGEQVHHKLISFKELPSGSIYIEPFTKRAINPMLRVFANNLEGLKKASERVGGQSAGLGDFSVTISVFPRVPVTFVIWLADDEFSASGNILFDASAGAYLPTEDYAIIAGMIIGVLKNFAE